MARERTNAVESRRPEVLRLFVGREPEVAEWEVALGLTAPTIIHVTGPGGIGKSALLRVFAERAQPAGLAVKELDARTVEPSIPGVRAALDAAGLVPESDRIVLLLDTYEELAACDFFVRSEILRRVGPHLVVIAGRGQPDAGWFASNGWGARVVHLPLKNLDAADTCHYLELRGIVGDRNEAVRAFCHGHPLALALAVEAELQAGGGPITAGSPGSDPDIVGALFERFVHELPDETSRTSLEVCALTRHLREDLLADFVGAEAASSAFSWLRRLSFVERSQHGVRLHDVARSVVLRDLRWRNPTRFEALFSRMLHVLAERAEKAGVGDPLQKMQEIQDFMRLAPEMRDQVEPTPAEQLAFDAATADDAPSIEKMLRAHEGDESVATFRRWFAVQREGFIVVRSHADAVLGFAGTLSLDERAGSDADPRIRSVWQHASPLLGSERGRVLYTPFWMTGDGYHRIDQARLALGAGMARRLVGPEPLALAYVHTTSTEADIAGLERTGARIVRELAFRQGGVEQVVGVYDWRSVTPLQWYVRCLRSMDAPAGAALPDPERPVTLDRDQFDAEVRAALRALHDPSRLKLSPLVNASFIGEGPEGRGARATRLRAALLQQIEGLRGAPQGDRQHRALHATFVDVAENQELAAERLGMAYSTFRRYLAAGVIRVIDELWSRELGEGD
jgi:hypothetical protein